MACLLYVARLRALECCRLRNQDVRPAYPVPEIELGDFARIDMSSSSQPQEPANVLYRIKRGLSGYVSYLAACEMNESFSEYVLYEPMLRILTARNYSVECEVVCPGIPQPPTGDRKRLDFVANGHGLKLAVEVKWAESRSIDARNDHSKLAAFLTSCGDPKGRAFLCVFGRESNIGSLALTPDVFEERGTAIIARFGVTRYGCRIFELRSPSKALQPTSRARRKTTSKRRSRAARG
jgi:hypothetical protein